MHAVEATFNLGVNLFGNMYNFGNIWKYDLKNSSFGVGLVTKCKEEFAMFTSALLITAFL